MVRKTNCRSARIGALIFSAILILSMLGGSALAQTNTTGKYYSAFATYQEEQDAASLLNEEISGESFVLMKNKDNALPLKADERMVTAFGISSVYSSYGAQGSGTQSVAPTQTLATFKSGLEQAGIYLNSAVYDAYKRAGSGVNNAKETSIGYAPYELSAEQLTTYISTFSIYGDAAIMMITREGGEGEEHEFSRTKYYDGSSKEEGAAYAHGLMLTPAERETLDFAKEYFDKVIVLINTTNPMELGELEDDDNVDAVVWIGAPGVSGFNAVGRMLTGEINPSGRTADMWPANMTQDPTWYNYADQSGVISIMDTDAVAGEASKAYDQDGNTVNFGGYTNIQTVSYLEGIYMGYRWYETQAELGNYFSTDLMPNNKDAAYDVTDPYYNRTNGVVYPFGYGMSYTTFDWSDFSAVLSEDGTTVVTQVTVTNTGDVAGKDVVEIYYKDPYYDGGIEKASANLVEFSKTDLLQPGEQQVVEISFEVKDMAAFDYTDANGNGFKGYELEAGDYVISARSDSHVVKGEAAIALGETLFDGSDDAHNYNAGYGKNAEPIFSADEKGSSDWLYNTAGQSDIQVYVSRAGGSLSLPAPVLNARYNEDWVTRMTVYQTYTAADAEVYHELYNTTYINNENGIPATWTQASADASEKTAIQLYDMVGVGYPTYIYDEETNSVIVGDDEATQKWDEYLNQLTFDELINIPSKDHGSANPIERIGLYNTYCNDGPSKMQTRGVGTDLDDVTYNGTWWASEVNIASTWNKELCYLEGLYIGNESLYEGVTGMWGFGLNTHRSAFGARAFEYYSEDGVLAGYISAAVTAGCTDMGVVVYNKHFALNDQDSYRNTADGSVVFVNEQALRQLYLKPYEIAVKDGGMNGAMMAFMRVGTISADNNYNLMEKYLREELGFKGDTCTDAGGGVCGDACILAGNDWPLMSFNKTLTGEWDEAGNTVTVDGAPNATQYYAVRKSAMHFLWGIANSNAVRNMVNTDSFASQDLEAVNGRSLNLSIAADDASTGAAYTTYTLKNGTLPAGVSLNDKAQLTGTPTEVGNYTFTVRMTADSYISKDVEFYLTVKRVFTQSTTEGKLGDEDFECIVSSDIVKVGDEYDSVEYSASGLPKGLTMAEDGVIYGTPEEAGQFEVVVKAVAQEAEAAAEETGEGESGDDEGESGGDEGESDGGSGGDSTGDSNSGPSSSTFTESFILTITE